MKIPNLNNVWETYIKITSNTDHIQLIRDKVSPLIAQLKDDGVIGWFCFLKHKSRIEGDTNRYIHLRFEIVNGVDEKNVVRNLLPDYCEKEMTNNFMDVQDPDEISGIDKSLLIDEQIEYGWRIIGEGSEWILNMLSIHKEEEKITTEQIGQFFHFFHNSNMVFPVYHFINGRLNWYYYDIRTEQEGIKEIHP